ncbi:TPA: antitoxin VbhA family protein [Klebsiella aerogenes]|nr:antitoxin VbhA family protein [Klebsiella aerogenes]
MSESYSREAIEAIFGPIDENAPIYIAPWDVSLAPDEHPKISIAEVEKRRKMVHSAFRNQQMSGVAPSPDLDDIWLDFIKGELEAVDLSAVINERRGILPKPRPMDGEREDVAPAFSGLRQR